MTTLTAQTTFNVLAAPEVYEETVDLRFLPENDGIDAVRELRYPGDIFPPIQYDSNPDYWENFDTGPMTDRPQFKGEMTIEDYAIVLWPGYIKDVPIKEHWKGSDKMSRMTAYMLRRLYEYYSNPPSTGFITWCPKDRINKIYNIVIEDLTVGGANTIQFGDKAIRNDMILWDVIFTFRIISEVT